jgi:hypothetical protein
MKKGDVKTRQKIIGIGSILFWKNKITAGLIYSSLIINLLVWLGLVALIKKSQEVVIAHYNVFFGIDKIVNLTEKGSLVEIFLVPMGGLVFLLLSIVMAVFLIVQFDDNAEIKMGRDVFISNRSISFVGSRLLLMGAWLLQLILLIYLVAVELINK